MDRALSARRLNRLAWFVAFTGIGGSMNACTTADPSAASPAAASKAKAFRFAPPIGLQYVRIDRRRQELAIVGVPLRRVDEEDLLWTVGIEREGDEYRVEQDLENATFVRNGVTLAKGKVPAEISADLLIDRDGNLREVRGLEKTAENLRSLAVPGMEAAAGKVLTPNLLTDAVASRYRVLFGETLGQDATPGSSWTLTNPPGSFVTSRTVTVTGHESCGVATCAHLEVEFQLDPRAVVDAAVDLVKSSVQDSGGDPSKVAVRKASYAMHGTMLVEPGTMLSHGAQLTEGGTVTVVDASRREITVQEKGTTELSYSYPAGERVALGPTYSGSVSNPPIHEAISSASSGPARNATE